MIAQILSYILFPDLISNSPYCLPYNYQDVSLNDLVLDEIIIL